MGMQEMRDNEEDTWDLKDPEATSIRDLKMKTDTLKRLESWPKNCVSGPSLRVDFICGGEQKAVFFRELPLGLALDRSMPATVTSVEDMGHAAKLGVQVGWVFKMVAGEDVTGKDFDTMLEFLEDAAATLADPGGDPHGDRGALLLPISADEIIQGHCR